MSEVKEISGKEGNFKVEIIHNPRYVDTDKCVACGLCSEKCPKKVNDNYNENLIKRKAIYLQYAQAVPLKYVIDEKNCIYFKNGKCRACEKFCPANAINFDDKIYIDTIKVGSIILAPGFKPFDPSKFSTYGYSNHKNVITSLEMERILSASGPTEGHLVRRSDNKEPKKIAWFQCIGSRNINQCDHDYCSSVCCMYAIKQAIISKEHSKNNVECSIFFMDMRTHGKDFEQYFNNAQKKGIKFIRARAHTVDPIPNSDDLSVRYVLENGDIVTDIFDKIVLSVGLKINSETIELSKKFNIKLTKGNFGKTKVFDPVSTSKKGIYICGAFQGPKDIPQSVIDASAAASAAGELLSNVRNTRTPHKEATPEINIYGERPRIGIFICKCGSNISGTVDINIVEKNCYKIPYVEHISSSLYSCSKDAQDKIVNLIKEYNLNRVVVAACSPRTHEKIFQETLTTAGLNKYLFEMCNIRNQNSWVHKKNPRSATVKAIDLIKMATYKVALTKPLKEAEIKIEQTVLIIGGGLAGLTAAYSLSKQNYKIHIIEKKDKLGGNVLNLHKTNDEKSVKEEISLLIEKINNKKNIITHLNSNIMDVKGFVGNFESEIIENKNKKNIKYGIAIIATGGNTYQPNEYLYNKNNNVILLNDLDKRFIQNDTSLKQLNTVIFIQCVGSRDSNQQEYCSRICCSHSIRNALELKSINPNINIYILYRDIRTYGENEYKYIKARKLGIIFIRYNLNEKPIVSVQEKNISVNIKDHILQKKIDIQTDLVVLASSIIPNNNKKISKLFKLPLNKDGFFAERHAKLGPSEFATDGVFLCGMAHYPKSIDESILQGRASSSRAVTLLSKGKMYNSGSIAKINNIMCSHCITCISICPYSAPSLSKNNIVEINPILCKGCGLCTASCRSGAIHLESFDNNQIFAQIFALNEKINKKTIFEN